MDRLFAIVEHSLYTGTTIETNAMYNGTWILQGVRKL